MIKIFINRSKKRLIATSLVLSILIALMIPVLVYAQSNFWQGGNVIQYETTPGAFNTGNDNKLTVSAKATVQQGSPGNVTLKLQKYSSGIYTTVKTMIIPTNGSIVTFADGYAVSINTNYRFVYSCGGTLGNDIANISLGIVIWQ